MFLFHIDEEPDIHVCGKCKKVFTELSEYMKHKQNKNCRHSATAISKSTTMNPSKVNVGQDEEHIIKRVKTARECSNQKTESESSGLNGSSSSTLEESIAVQISRGNVEVQILEPLEAQEVIEVATSEAGALHSPRVRHDHVYSKDQHVEDHTSGAGKSFFFLVLINTVLFALFLLLQLFIF